MVQGPYWNCSVSSSSSSKQIKFMKLSTCARSGENVHLIWVSEVGVAKLLNSATYKISTK